MELLGILIIFLLGPLEVFFKIGNVTTLSKLLGGLVLFTFSLRTFRKKTILIPREGYILLIFVLLGFTSSIWAMYPVTSITRSITLFQLFILYTITYNTLRNNNSKLYRNMYNIIIIFGVILSVYTISRVFKVGSINNWTRISISEEVDVNHLSSFLMIPFLLALDYSFTRSLKYILASIAILTAILMTQSRGAIVTLIVGVGIYLYNNYKKEGIKLRYISTIGLIFLFIDKFIPEAFLYRMKLMFTDKEVLIRGSGRNFIWGQALDLFKTKPIVGIGLGNFTRAHRPPHSSFFQIISEQGLIGLVIITIFVLTMLYKKNERNSEKVSIEYIIILSLLIMSLTVDIFYQKYLWIMMSVYSSKKNEKNIYNYQKTLY